MLGALVFTLIFTAMPVQAETATSTTSALTSQLQALLKQVSELQAQMEKLNKERVVLTKDIIETRIALTKNLREGMTDEEIKVLQELLAQDPVIYPEGLVTGYWGPLTTKAIKRFQEKHGIEAVGEVGPKTKAKLNELVSHGAWKAGDLPPGIAKRFTSTSSVENLPPGIYKKYIEQFWSKKGKNDDDEDEEEDDDTSTLEIEDIEVDETGSTTARIKWHTDEKSKGTLYYSTDSAVEMEAASTVKKMSSSKKSHDIRFSGLEAGETYYVLIVAENSDDTVTSEVFSFEMDGEDEDVEDEEEDDDEDDDDDDDEDDDGVNW